MRHDHAPRHRAEPTARATSFGVVVEGYLRERAAGRARGRSAGRARSTSRRPRSATCCRSWRRSACSRAPHTSAGRMPTETGLRLFVDGMMQVAEPSAEERAAIERAAVAARADRGGARDRQRAAVGPVGGAGHGAWCPRARAACCAQMSFVPLSADRALAVLVGEDGRSRTAWSTSAPRRRRRAGAGEQLTSPRASPGCTLAEARAADAARDCRRPLALDDSEPRPGRARPRGLERGRRAAPGADRARAGEPARRSARSATSSACACCSTS